MLRLMTLGRSRRNWVFWKSWCGVFGSVVRNEVTEGSDIDIVVEMEPNILKRVGLKQELEKLFNNEVDVIRYRTSMNPYLKSEIDRETIYT